jgi:hypothetical protein
MIPIRNQTLHFIVIAAQPAQAPGEGSRVLVADEVIE